MANRILVWHIPSPGAVLPIYYAERDYTPAKLRIMAGNAPRAKEFWVDIKDDGVSILSDRAATHQRWSEKYTTLGYNTLATSTFRVGESVSGGTSGAAGIVRSDGHGNMELSMTTAASFADGETITGATSTATAKVISSARGSTNISAITTDSPITRTVLALGQSLEDMADLFDGEVTIEEGSLITCDVEQMGDAGNVTVQLELESLTDEGDESD